MDMFAVLATHASPVQTARKNMVAAATAEAKAVAETIATVFTWVLAMGPRLVPHYTKSTAKFKILSEDGTEAVEWKDNDEGLNAVFDSDEISQDSKRLMRLGVKCAVVLLALRPHDDDDRTTLAGLVAMARAFGLVTWQDFRDAASRLTEVLAGTGTQEVNGAKYPKPPTRGAVRKAVADGKKAGQVKRGERKPTKRDKSNNQATPTDVGVAAALNTVASRIVLVDTWTDESHAAASRAVDLITDALDAVVLTVVDMDCTAEIMEAIMATDG